MAAAWGVRPKNASVAGKGRPAITSSGMSCRFLRPQGSCKCGEGQSPPMFNA